MLKNKAESLRQIQIQLKYKAESLRQIQIQLKAQSLMHTNTAESTKLKA
jgi:hypothetical protein